MGRLEVLAVLPAFFGNTGDAVNERQLVEALSSYAKCRVVVVWGVTGLIDKSKRGELVSRVREEARKGITVIPLFIPQPSFLSMPLNATVSLLLALLTWLRVKLTGKPDLIYVRRSDLAVGFVQLRATAERTVVKIPALVEDEARAPLIDRFDRHALAKARCIAVPSPVLLRNLLMRRGLRPRKAVLVPPGISRERILKAKQLHEECRRQDRYTVGFLGLLARWQGVDLLVRAVARLKGCLDKPVKLVVIGDGPERRRIERLCTELNVECTITGFVDHRKALEFLSCLDVLVLPRRRTPTTESNIPIKVIEAWALGVPVVVTKHQVFLALGYKDYEDIVYCEPQAESIAHAVAKVLTSPALRENLAKKGIINSAKYDYSKIARKLIEIFS
jgi:glycosyltransferase involved in cell wall biosynthesis